MKKLLVAVLVIWTLVYFVDFPSISTMHWHLDLEPMGGTAVEWLFGGLVLLFVFVVLAAILATGILAAFVFAAVVSVFCFIALGLSALWPVTIAIALYLLCRDKPQNSY